MCNRHKLIIHSTWRIKSSEKVLIALDGVFAYNIQGPSLHPDGRVVMTIYVSAYVIIRKKNIDYNINDNNT